MAQNESPIFGPTSFRDYCDKHEIAATSRTPRYISIDTKNDLDTQLREHDTMVLRTGAAHGTGTAFLLVEATENINEFFLDDENAFPDNKPKTFSSPVNQDKLLSFNILPKLSETSLVNLALASGALGKALDIDESGALMPPATGRSTFTFEIRPHSSIDETYDHRTGQVEVDTLFAERRNGDMTLFVIEAKTGTNRSSLAKHKLVYPALALADQVPDHIPLVPVYLRCTQTPERNAMKFRVAECDLPDPRDRIPGIDELEVERSTGIELELNGPEEDC